jgi:catechol 2,3-dioxygenase-like lactoylglutathione lyase family enzyme
MPSIESVVLESPDPAAAAAFYDTAFGLGSRLAVRTSEEPSDGFRGFTLSLVVAQPADVDAALIGAAVDGGATTLKPPAESFWGFGGVVRAPDGAIWKVASSKKKDSGPATREIHEAVLLLGVGDVKATKSFYVDHGLKVAKSFRSKYIEFASPSGTVKLALYGRRALAKDAGVPLEGGGSHRMAEVGDVDAFADPDGFAWESASADASSREIG